MGRKLISIIVCLACLSCLVACFQKPGDTGAAEVPTVSTDIGTPSPAETDDANAAASPPDTAPITDGEIGRLYADAISALEPTVILDVSGKAWKYGAENDLKNLYYSVLSQQPELKYAYDVTISVSDGTAECTFSYMPYKSGAYDGGLPAGSHTVGSLHDAEVMAQSMTDGTSSLSIAITDPALDVDSLQRALGQAGYGWIAFTLSRDGTAILASPPVGMTLEDCADRIGETFDLAGGIIANIITDGMTDREKVEAAYSYITENVSYDFRYYSGKGDMPYESTAALGALRDNLAVCGGYSHALETLLDMCGIENYTVSGASNGEYHAWNYVVLDDEGYYCDPTADRGGMSRHFLLTAEELESLGGYIWDADFYPAISR